MAGRIHIAGYNSARGLTLAGESKDLVLFESVLQRERIGYKRLPLDTHSIARRWMALNPKFAPRSRTYNRARPRFPSIQGSRENTLTGRSLMQSTGGTMASSVLRCGHVGDCRRVERTDGNHPHPILKSYLSDALEVSQRGGIALSTLTRNRDTGQDLIDSVGELLVALGNAGDTQTTRAPGIGQECLRRGSFSVFPKVGARVDLPHYPWQRERHWLEHTAESPGTLDRRCRFTRCWAHVYRILDWTWERRIDPTRVPFLADHVIGKRGGNAWFRIPGNRTGRV